MLKQRLETCASGATLDLGSEQLGAVHLRGFHFSEPVTIAGGRFDDLDLTDCSGLTFRGTQLFCPNVPLVYHRHRITRCERIRFEDCEVFGDVGVAVEENHAIAMLVRETADFAATSCRFHHLKHGLAFMGVTRFEASRNVFHDIRVDGIRGGGASGLTIADNLLHDFYPVDTGGAGDHPDAIQVWAHAEQENRDIAITGNRFERREGRPVQGVFLRGNYPGSTGFDRVRIEGNTVIGGLYNAILLSNAREARVCDNEIRWLDDRHSTWLRIEGVEGEICGNTAPMFHGAVPPDQNAVDQSVWSPDKAPAAEPQEAKPTEVFVEPGTSILVTAQPAA